ncbi:MAG: hypothetical protein U0269_14575 [Polyangiales bacterium]
MARSESRWVAYGAVSAALSRVLPPFVDGPFLRAVRGAMVDRVAKESGVTLTAEARKLLVSLDDPMSARGRVEKGARWLVTRVVPGLATVDTTVHLVTTFTAGALLKRYFEARPKSETGAVVDGFEATRVRRALKVALDFASAEHARGLASAVTSGTGAAVDGARSKETAAAGAKALAERAIAAVDAGASTIPVAWIDAVEPIFRREFER